MERNEITIGGLSAHAGVNVETIRYYEKIGLLPKPARSPGGHRLYDGALIRRLMFVRRGRELGFSLDDVRSLLGLGDKTLSCAEVYALTDRHLAGIRAKIADLRKLERTLSAVARDCDKSAAPDCPIIDALSSPPRVDRAQ